VTQIRVIVICIIKIPEVMIKHVIIYRNCIPPYLGEQQFMKIWWKSVQNCKNWQSHFDYIHIWLHTFDYIHLITRRSVLKTCFASKLVKLSENKRYRVTFVFWDGCGKKFRAKKTNLKIRRKQKENKTSAK